MFLCIDGLQLSGPGTCLGGLELFGLELSWSGGPTHAPLIKLVPSKSAIVCGLTYLISVNSVGIRALPGSLEALGY